MARAGDPNPVAVADDGSSVEDDEKHIVWIFATTQKREDAVVGVVGIQPLKPLPIEIDLMESRLCSEQLIEILDEALDTSVGVVFQKMPIEAARFTPLPALGKFLTHEEKFLARMCELVGKQ